MHALNFDATRMDGSWFLVPYRNMARLLKPLDRINLQRHVP